MFRTQKPLVRHIEWLDFSLHSSQLYLQDGLGAFLIPNNRGELLVIYHITHGPEEDEHIEQKGEKILC